MKGPDFFECAGENTYTKPKILGGEREWKGGRRDQDTAGGKAERARERERERNRGRERKRGERVKGKRREGGREEGREGKEEKGTRAEGERRWRDV